MIDTQDFELLTQRDIIDLLIEGTKINSPLPYITANEIKSIGIKFGVSVSGDNLSRWQIMMQIINRTIELEKIDKLLDLLLSPVHLRDSIVTRLKNQNNDIDFLGTSMGSFGWNPDPSEQQISDERQKIENELFDAINQHLIYSSKKIMRSGSHVVLVDSDSAPEIRTDKEKITIAYVRDILSNAQSDLTNGDFDSVITKARTILEETFIQILHDHQCEVKQNGNIGQYRNEVSRILKMRPDATWENPRAKEFISRLNALVDSIAEIRNTDGDAHGSSNRIRVKEAEAELIINSAANLSIYYLKVSDRK